MMIRLIAYFLICVWTYSYVHAQMNFEWLNDDVVDNAIFDIIPTDEGYYLSVSKGCSEFPFKTRIDIWEMNNVGQITKILPRDKYCDTIRFSPGVGRTFTRLENRLYGITSLDPFNSHIIVFTEYDLDLNIIDEQELDVGQPQYVSGLQIDREGNKYILFKTLQSAGKGPGILKLNDKNELILQRQLPYQGANASSILHVGYFDFQWAPSGDLWLLSRVRYDNPRLGDIMHYIHVIDTNLEVVDYIHEEDLDGLSLDRDEFENNYGCVLNDGSYIISQSEEMGIDSPLNIYNRPVLYNFDDVGNLQWSTPIEDDEIYSILEVKQHPTNGGVYVFGDSRHAFYKPQPRTEGVFLACLSSNGNFKWIRKYYRMTDEVYWVNGTNMEFCPNGGVVMVGAGGPKNGLNEPYNSWIMKVDEDGCLDDDCSGRDFWVSTIDNYQTDWSVYPNPTQDMLTLYSRELSTSHTWSVYSITGQVLTSGECESETTSIHLHHSGLNLIVIKDSSGAIVYRETVVKL